MMRQDNLFMGKNAELMHIAMRENQRSLKKRKTALAVRQRISSYEEYLRRNAVPRACYVYINGISMPVL